MTSQNPEVTHKTIEGAPPNKIILKRNLRGQVETNVPCLHRHHSPTGFEFGYGGSGPADFALNILQYCLEQWGHTGPRVYFDLWDGSRCFELAWRLHQLFKWDFIAPQPAQGASILRVSMQTIRNWIEANRPEGLEI